MKEFEYLIEELDKSNINGHVYTHMEIEKAIAKVTDRIQNRKLFVIKDKPNEDDLLDFYQTNVDDGFSINLKYVVGIVNDLYIKQDSLYAKISFLDENNLPKKVSLLGEGTLKPVIPALPTLHPTIQNMKILDLPSIVLDYDLECLVASYKK